MQTTHLLPPEKRVATHELTDQVQHTIPDGLLIWGVEHPDDTQPDPTGET